MSAHAAVGGKADVSPEGSHCLFEYTAYDHPLFAYTIRRLKSPPRVASHLSLVIIWAMALGLTSEPIFALPSFPSSASRCRIWCRRELR